MFNVRGHTMDGFSKERIEKQINARIEVVADFKEMITVLNRIKKEIKV